eukprot:c2741_g1_i2.p1 GENE.c2741_g1_i2~~c2741_g1_i2.p1  ORF type:complete len:228 (-),score=46.11 c2741_g1_i2:746-1429(-)
MCEISQVAEALRNHIGGVIPNAAILEGVHAEGPLVSDLGGLPFQDKAMTLERFQQFVDSLPGLRMMTLSPGVDAKHNHTFTHHLVARGVVPAFGHDKHCSEADIIGAFRAAQEARRLHPEGPRAHMTHIFNVSSFGHRSPGLVNFGLLSKFPNLPEYEGLEPVSVEIVGDGEHVGALAVQLLLQSKNHNDICFITDAIADPNTQNNTARKKYQLKTTWRKDSRKQGT